ncbi:hypothetical protein [Streptomyces hebeiensis]
MRTVQARGSGLPTPGRLPAVAGLLTDDAPPGWAVRVLESGRALLLVDGVDEVPASERDNTRTWLTSSSWIRGKPTISQCGRGPAVATSPRRISGSATAGQMVVRPAHIGRNPVGQPRMGDCRTALLPDDVGAGQDGERIE